MHGRREMDLFQGKLSSFNLAYESILRKTIQEDWPLFMKALEAS